MKDLNISSNPKSLWISKTMQTLKNLKKWNIGEIKFRNIKKLDKEIKALWILIDDYKNNKISKEDYNKEFNITEKVIWSIIKDNYFQKYWKAPDMQISLNKLPTTWKSKFDLWFKRKNADSKIESFQTVDEVLDRMKYLYG